MKKNILVMMGFIFINSLIIHTIFAAINLDNELIRNIVYYGTSFIIVTVSYLQYRKKTKTNASPESDS